MTFIQKHKSLFGKFKTSAGYPVIIDHSYTGFDKIVGFVCFRCDYNMPIEWNINGKPLILPLHQGLGLVPLKEVVSYEVIPLEERS